VSNSNCPDRARRAFLMMAVAAGSAVLAVPVASAQTAAAEPVSPTDPLAKALGYTPESGNVDKGKFPTYKPGQECAKCRFYQGQTGKADGPCQIFAGKLVKSSGWCSSFVAKS
jgi:hypothetical protein